MYADPEYEVVNTQEELESRKRTCEMMTERKVKAIKGEKPLKAIKTEDPLAEKGRL